MIALLSIDHELELWELLRDRKHFFLIDFFVAGEKGPSWLLAAVERVLAEITRVTHP